MAWTLAAVAFSTSAIDAPLACALRERERER